MNLLTTLRTLGKFSIRHAPMIWSVAAAGGVVATGVTAAQAGAEYQETKDKKVFIKPVVTGVATIACIFTGDRLHAKRYAALAGAASVVERNFRDYRDIYAPDVDNVARNEVNEKRAEDIWEKCKRNGIKPVDTHTGNDLWFEPESMTWFLASESHVKDAAYHTNRNFKLRGSEPFNEWLKFLGLPDDDLSFEMLGWYDYEGEAYYGYTWIDFELKPKELRDGTKYTEIFYPFGPHLTEK